MDDPDTRGPAPVQVHQLDGVQVAHNSKVLGHWKSCRFSLSAILDKHGDERCCRRGLVRRYFVKSSKKVALHGV